MVYIELFLRLDIYFISSHNYLYNSKTLVNNIVRL